MAKDLEQITEEIINKKPNLLVRILKTQITYLTASLLSLLSCEANPGTQVEPYNSGQQCSGQNCYGTTNTKPSNKVMDQTTAYYLNSISADKSTLIFNGQSTYAQNLIQGDLIIAGVTDKTQEGLLRKVTSVTKNPNQVIAYTMQATLEEAVPEGTVQLSFSLPTGNAKADSATNNFYDAEFDSAQLPLSFAGGQIYEFDHKELFSGIYLDGSMHIAVNADFQFKNSTLYGTKEVRFVTKGLEELELIVSGEFHNGINKELPPVELVKFSPIVVIPPGFVFPVVITPHLTLTLGVNANGNISAQTSITQSLVLDAGLEYKNNTWSKIQNIQPEFSSTLPEFTGASGDFTVYVKPQLLLDFYGLDGPYIALKGYLQALATVIPPDNVSCSIIAGIDALVGVHIEIISKTLFDYEASVYKYEKEIFNCSNSSSDCISHDSFICGEEEKKVYWRDSCGNIEEAAMNCTGDSYCFNGECVTGTETCEDNCDTSNEKSCSGKDVIKCEYNSSTGCLELVVQKSCGESEKCESGECKPIGSTCEDECDTYNKTSCSGKNVMICNYNNSTGCLELVVQESCGESEKCESEECVPNETVCTPKADKICLGKEVWWVDSCETLDDFIEKCTSDAFCQDGECVPCVANNGCGEPDCIFYDDFNGNNLDKECKWWYNSGNVYVNNSFLVIEESSQVQAKDEQFSELCPNGFTLEYISKLENGQGMYYIGIGDKIAILVDTSTNPNQIGYTCGNTNWGNENIDWISGINLDKENTIKLQKEGDLLKVYVNSSLPSGTITCTQTFSNLFIITYEATKLMVDNIKLICD